MLHLHFNPETDVSKVLAPEALNMFQFEWKIYQKLVHANEMHHREIGQLLRDEIGRRFDRPFAFLDLACGDASLAHMVLQGSKVATYEGLDLSRPALQCAARVMKDVPYEVELAEEDMVEGILRRQTSANFIWCGYSIHHLQRAQKQEMLSAIRGALKPGGVFVCAEPVCLPGETRADYTRRWQADLRRRFRSLNEAEYAHLWQHISTHDFPEPPEDWVAMGKTAGFASSQEIYRFPGDLFCAAFLYEK
ncbi:class I SAM-dependent methyltransferase [Roseibium sp. FZY0029]|uniref:class I SAM-dependent methyltransferase n=1 Tax=Roseibium sp. FZY0029 TaxID=3116647 RepID=UPI002EB61528|nr:class I SAM-dependent methyltransferase [Roseibium sp. FZY0029]